MIYRQLIFKIFKNKEIKKFLEFYSYTIINALISFLSISYLTNVILPDELAFIGLYSSILYFVPSLITFSSHGLLAIEMVNKEKQIYIVFRNKLLSFISRTKCGY